MSKEAYTPPPTSTKEAYSPPATGSIGSSAQSFAAVPPRAPAPISYLCAGSTKRV